ncbi:hypothetical protein CGL56_15065 [Neolewinella marina]|uniref:Uncharacterized protein n=2 Tax=Neolewinella marina TaxID=438751 RepID=A0A2G0CCN9_9BACT|nr:hypothetical protein CGL56_15065 [Neolewinella marina]
MYRRTFIGRGTLLLFGLSACPALGAAPSPSPAPRRRRYATYLAEFERQLRENMLPGTPEAVIRNLCTPIGGYHYPSPGKVTYYCSSGEEVILQRRGDQIIAHIN